MRIPIEESSIQVHSVIKIQEPTQSSGPSQVIIHNITANQICLIMSSAGLSPILPIFCDVCAQDFNSVDTAVTHFTFKKHWTVRNSCVKPAIFIPGKTFKVPIFQGYFIVVAIF